MKRKALNAITSVMLQMATVVCGFVLPRMILAHYGSDVNGLVQSISQFMGYIVLAELGVAQCCNRRSTARWPGATGARSAA